LSRAAKLDHEILKFKLSRCHPQSQGPAQAGGNGVAQGDSTRSQLRPAHNNLAVIYISQMPPLVELARWHYQRRSTPASPPNRTEKMLDAKGAPANPQ